MGPPALISRKRRAARACASCNARKVRCEKEDNGYPCTGCRIEGYDCHIPERRKRRKRRKANREQPNQHQADVIIQDDTDFNQQSPADSRTLAPSITTGNQSADTNANNLLQAPESPKPSLSQHTILHQVPHYPFIINFAHISTDGEVGFQPPTLTTSSQRSNTNSVPFESVHKAPQDLSFLQQKEAFDLPERKIMDEFVFHYFQFIHPFFPIIEKTTFFDRYRQTVTEGQDDVSGPSLLLLQAVLFSASSVTPLELLERAGYDSRKIARQSLYDKTKLLYYFDYEMDNVVVVQALLLISHYYSSMIDQKHTWYWVHQAISLAQATGLHRNPGNIPQHRLWARIWWGCLVRDRLVSLGTGRPMHVNSLDCDVPMLSLEDLREEGDSLDECAVKETFVELIKLCQLIEGVLSLRYSPAAAARVTPEQVKVCDDALKLWLQNLPPSARRQEESLGITGYANIATLYRSILRQLYKQVFITVIALHQPHHVHGTQEVEFHQQSQQVVKLAALDTTNLVTQLVNYDLVKYCPTYCPSLTPPPHDGTAGVNGHTPNTANTGRREELIVSSGLDTRKNSEDENGYLPSAQSINNNEEANFQYGMSMGGPLLNTTADEDIQFGEWLKGYETFQNVFPSA
ncbi:hypothetical protein B7463_g10557, partial [Scytalidium lignicola]